MKKLLLFILLLFINSQAYALISGSTVWEYRTTGAANNSGGFVSTASGTDYSQQNADQYNNADLASTNGTTNPCGVTSALHTFAAADVGNLINITAGTNWTAGRYEIVSVAAGVATLDRACGSVAVLASGTYYVGGAIDLMTDAIWELHEPGNIVYIKAGTYTLGGAISLTTADGTEADKILIEGYNTSRGDNPTGTNRPLITNGANAFVMANYYLLRNLRFSTTTTPGVDLNGTGPIAYNVRSINTSAVSGRAAFNSSSRCSFINVEAIGTGCSGFADGGSAGYFVYRSYIHDSSTGIVGTTNNLQTFVKNILDTNTTGISIAAVGGCRIVDNTFYNNTTGLSGSTPGATVIVNNIFDTNTTGVNFTTTQTSEFLDWNDFNGNGTDVSGVTKGDNDSTGAPGMDNPASGDFDVSATIANTGCPYPNAEAGTTNSQSYEEPGALQKSCVATDVFGIIQ